MRRSCRSSTAGATCWARTCSCAPCRGWASSPDEVTAVASAARQAFTAGLSAGSVVAARATAPAALGAALFLPARAGQPVPAAAARDNRRSPAPSAQPVRDRHADTLPLSTVFGELDGPTRFLAPLLPAPELGVGSRGKVAPLLLGPRHDS